MIALLNWIALLIVAASAIGLLISRDWRWGLGLLAGLYLGRFLLLREHWPLSAAAAKLVSGWMVCTMLALAHMNLNEPLPAESFWPQGRLFRILTAVLTLAATFALALRLAYWLGIDLPVAWGGLLLMGLGLIHLGITGQPFRVTLGLLTVLAGFEIVYAAVENSTLVAALLSVIDLGLAMAGAYFLTSPQEVPS
jgi:hypothetical protein